MTTLTLRNGTIAVPDPGALIEWYDANVTFGPTYYAAPPPSDVDTVGLESIGYAVLFVGRPGATAAKSLVKSPISIASVPTSPLAELDDQGLDDVADAIARVASLEGFGSALATKIMHKMRCDTIPVLDNKAIYGTFMVSTWFPGRDAWPRRSVSVKSRAMIASALHAVAVDVGRPENKDAWVALEGAYPALTRSELFDKLWWAIAHDAVVTPPVVARLR